MKKLFCGILSLTMVIASGANVFSFTKKDVPCVKNSTEVREKKEENKLTYVAPLNAESLAELEKIIDENKDKIVLLDIYATWCGPCKMLAPELEALQNENGDKVVVVKVDSDSKGINEIRKKYQFNSFPTMFFFKDGKQVKKISGYKPKEKLLEIINAL